MCCSMHGPALSVFYLQVYIAWVDQGPAIDSSFLGRYPSQQVMYVSICLWLQALKVDLWHLVCVLY